MKIDKSGISTIEVLIALIVFSIGVLGLTSAGLVAARQMKRSEADTRAWAAARYQLEQIRAQGYDGVTAGSTTALGYSVSWDVVGASPKKVILVVQAENWKREVVPDTFVTYLANWK